MSNMRGGDLTQAVLKWQTSVGYVKEDLFIDILSSVRGMMTRHIDFTLYQQGMSEDILQEMSIGVYYAAVNFRPSFKCSFSTYAFFWIKRGKSEFQTKRLLVYQPPTSKYKIDQIYVEFNPAVISSNPWEAFDNYLDFKSALRGLDLSDISIITKQIEGHTVQQMAGMFKITHQGLHFRINKMYDKIRSNLNRTVFIKQFSEAGHDNSSSK